MNRKHTILALVALLSLVLGTSAVAKPTVVAIDQLRADERQRQTALIITQVMEKFHYRKPRLDDEMSSAVLDRYLESLDANRSFFSARDVAAFERYRLTLDDSLRTGKLDPAFQIFDPVSGEIICPMAVCLDCHAPCVEACPYGVQAQARLFEAHGLLTTV